MQSIEQLEMPDDSRRKQTRWILIEINDHATPARIRCAVTPISPTEILVIGGFNGWSRQELGDVYVFNSAEQSFKREIGML